MRGFAILALAAGLACAVAAQEMPGGIVGRITDVSGSVVGGARIRAVRAGSEAASTAASDVTGSYFLPRLRPGVYAVTIEMPGFRPFERRVAVRAGEETILDARLEIASARESIRVVDEAPPLIRMSAGLFGMVIDAEELLEVPLRDGNAAGLALLAPGAVSLAEEGTSRAYENENVSAISMHGAGPGSHEFSINGAVNTGGMSGNVAFVPPAAAVSEIRVSASPFDARRGFSMGSEVALSLRSGGSRLHGQLHYALENPVANANSFFSNRSGSGKDNFRESRWVAYAGGPLPASRLRQRLFWLYAGEEIRARQPYRSTSLSYTVPTPMERRGNFSDLLAFGKQYQIYDPLTTRPSSTAGRLERSAFAGNLIPPSRISQTAARILDTYYPLPNVPGAKPTGVNYVMPSLAANWFSSHLARLDYQAGARDWLHVRGSWSDRAQQVEYRFNGGGGAGGERENRGLAVSNVFTVRPRLALNLRYSYTRYMDDYAPPSAGLDLTSLGFSPVYVDRLRAVDARNLMLPDITPAGYPELNGQAMSRSASDIHALAADVASSSRSHTMHYGGEHRVYRDASANTGRSSGKLNFNTNWTRGPLDNSPAAPVGQGLASFLLGLPTDGSMDVNASLAQQYQVSALYFQDMWRLRRTLIVNLGIRWEHEIPVTERYDRAVRGFDFGAVSPIAAAVQAKYAQHPAAQLAPADFHVRGGVLFAGVNGQPRELWDASLRNFAPRAGVAWMIGRHTVVRCGYGMFYDVARQKAVQTGFSRTTSLVPSQDNGQTYIASLEDPFPAGFAMPAGSSLGLMTNLGQSVAVLPGRLLNPYMQRWELSVQRAPGRQMAIEIGYVGTRGTHLRVQRQLDPIPLPWLSTLPVRDNARYALLTTNLANPFYPLLPSTSLAGATVQLQQLLRPYPQFTSVTTLTNEGFSWYHGLQALLQRRFTGSGFVWVACTWSKFMEATARMNEADPVPAHSISPSDRSHRFVAAGVYEFPFGRGKRWAAAWKSGIRGAVAGGWQWQAVYQRQSGAPLSFGNVIYYGANIHDIGLPADQRTRERWFNTADFERNSASQLVYNVRVFPLRFAGIRSMGLDFLDLGMSKNLRLAERISLQLRADAFNCLNRSHFAPPNTTPTSTDFGAVTATSQLPRHIEFAVRVRF
jgi:hypothetical protein